ncbi:hypothetical protein AB1Y20_001514 [Prymnesium parvum]|uniref:Armadillo repeat-containing protein 8 n=1 Tax=Prymnesium parvum TaxID=97485 RepID=A0AB34K9R6_PRYPA
MMRPKPPSRLASSSREMSSPTAIASLVAALEGPTDSISRAVRALWDLAAQNGMNRTAIAAAGGIELLVATLRCPNENVQEAAAAVLWHLTLTEDGDVTAGALAAAGATPHLVLMHECPELSNQRAGVGSVARRAEVASMGGVKPLISLLSSGNPAVQRVATGVLSNICISHKTIRAQVVAASGVPPLVALLLGGAGSDVQKFAATTLQHLAIDEVNRSAIVSANGMIPLIALLDSSVLSVQGAAAGALGNLVETSGANKEQVTIAGGLPPLLRFVHNAPIGWKVAGLNALRNLAAESAMSQAALVAAGAIPQLVSLLSSELPGACSLAAATLGNLAGSGAYVQARIAAAGALEPLISLLGRSHVQVLVEAASAIWNLCHAQDSLQAAGAAAISPLVALLTHGDLVVCERAAGALLCLTITNSHNQQTAREAGVSKLLRKAESTSGLIPQQVKDALYFLVDPDTSMQGEPSLTEEESRDAGHENATSTGQDMVTIVQAGTSGELMETKTLPTQMNTSMAFDDEIEVDGVPPTSPSPLLDASSSLETGGDSGVTLATQSMGESNHSKTSLVATEGVKMPGSTVALTERVEEVSKEATCMIPPSAGHTQGAVQTRMDSYVRSQSTTERDDVTSHHAEWSKQTAEAKPALSCATDESVNSMDQHLSGVCDEDTTATHAKADGSSMLCSNEDNIDEVHNSSTHSPVDAVPLTTDCEGSNLALQAKEGKMDDRAALEGADFSPDGLPQTIP